MLKPMYLKSMAVVLTLCAISRAASAATEANSVGMGQTVKSDTNDVRPVWANAVTKLFPDWKIIQCDQIPTIQVGTHKACRLVLQKSRKEYPALISSQQKPSHSTAYDKFILRYSHIDLIILPEDTNELSTQIKEKIPWLELEQEQFVKPVYMGKGLGFDWFVNTTLFYQEYLREKLGLEGGDDRLQLLVNGLFVQDNGSGTRNSVEQLVAKGGDKALPYIQKAVEQHINNNPGLAVRPLAYMYSEQSTLLLKSYYALPQTHDAAAYALIHQPYREACKKEYFDMLSSQKSVNYVTEACVKFQWKDAIPVLEGVCSNPHSWAMFRDAYLAKRFLEGHPVSDEVAEAKKNLQTLVWSPDKIDSETLQKAKQTMLQSQDVDIIAVLAIDMVLLSTKANQDNMMRLKEVGWEILRKLPVQTTRQIVVSAIDSLKNEEYHGGELQKLEDFLGSLPEKN
jgi:hypothetical protein